MQSKLQSMEGTKKRVEELKTKNSNYRNELLELHNWPCNRINEYLGSINSEQVALQWTFEQEHANWKVVEQSLSLINKILKAAKVKVEQLEGQNKALIEKTHKHQLELQCNEGFTHLVLEVLKDTLLTSIISPSELLNLKLYGSSLVRLLTPTLTTKVGDDFWWSSYNCEISV